MRIRPISFSSEMVLAILGGLKTQTRRPVKHKYPLTGAPSIIIPSEHEEGFGFHTEEDEFIKCPYGSVGDTLYVREGLVRRQNGYAAYAADGKQVLIGGPGINEGVPWGWKRNYLPPMFMPRYASRITLEITSVHAERLQSISREDAIAEGLSALTKDGSTIKYGIPDRDGLPGDDDFGWHWHEWHQDPIRAYRVLWEKITAYGSWDLNPWVWVIKFMEVKHD